MGRRSLHPRLSRTAGWLALANAALLAAPLMRGAVAGGEGESLLGALVAFVWAGSAPWGAAALAAGSRTRTGALTFLGVEILLVASSLAVLCDLAFGPAGSTAGLVYLTGPLAQWAALLLATALSFAAGWRMRAGWPDPT